MAVWRAGALASGRIPGTGRMRDVMGITRVHEGGEGEPLRPVEPAPFNETWMLSVVPYARP
jgi:hypothetical protein